MSRIYDAVISKPSWTSADKNTLLFKYMLKIRLKMKNNYTERIKPTMYCYKHQFWCRSSAISQDWGYTFNGMERWLIQNQLRSESSAYNMLKLTNADTASTVTVTVTIKKTSAAYLLLFGIDLVHFHNTTVLFNRTLENSRLHFSLLK